MNQINQIKIIPTKRFKRKMCVLRRLQRRKIASDKLHHMTVMQTILGLAAHPLKDRHEEISSETTPPPQINRDCHSPKTHMIHCPPQGLF